MRRDYGTRDNALLVPHQQWIRNPPTIRAQASRTLSLYQYKMLIAVDNSNPFHKQRWKCTVEQYTLYNNMTDKLEKLTETILERARKETKEYNRVDQSFLLLEDLKRAVARLESANAVMLPMVRALYDQFIVTPAAKRRRVHAAS